MAGLGACRRAKTGRTAYRHSEKPGSHPTGPMADQGQAAKGQECGSAQPTLRAVCAGIYNPCGRGSNDGKGPGDVSAALADRAEFQALEIHRPTRTSAEIR